MASAQSQEVGAASSSVTQEFVIRAPGAAHTSVEYFLGRFPSGSADFKKRKASWSLTRQPKEDSRQSRRPDAKGKVRPWVLEDKPGHATHTGHPEGGLSGTGMATGYFFLVKEGPHFTAIPVKEWYNFRPSIRHQTLTLEEAERQMDSQGHGIRLAAGSKLAAMAAKAAEDGEELLDGEESGDDPDSDEEERRVQRLRGSGAAAKANGGAAGGAAEDEDMPGAQVAVDKGKKGEDWEHEDEHADDDLNQGDEEGSDAEVPTTGKRGPRPSSGSDDEEEEEAGDHLTAAGQEVQRILRKTHLGSDSEEADGTQASESLEDDEDDDDVDLDAMASGIMPKAKGARQATSSAPASRRTTPQPGQRAATPTPGGKGAGKRKAATPPVHDDAKKVKPEVKTEVKVEVKEEATSQPRPISAGAAAPQGPPTQAEIVAGLRSWGPVTTSELTSRFKKRIVAQADKKNFMAVVKRVSKLEEMPPGSGKKFVVLR